MAKAPSKMDTPVGPVCVVRRWGRARRSTGEQPKAEANLEERPTTLVPHCSDDVTPLALDGAPSDAVDATADRRLTDSLEINQARAAPSSRTTIQGRPQPGNDSGYYSGLHRKAGRRHWGPPEGMGKGSYGKWAHRKISRRSDGVDVRHEVDLFKKFLEQRGLLEKVKEEPGAGQFFNTDASMVHNDAVAPSVYFSIKNVTPLAANAHTTQAYCGTYIYLLWSMVTGGARPSGCNGDGGDFKQEGFYCTPNRELGYAYAVPQQMFHNGHFDKVVFDVELDRSFMQSRGEQHAGQPNHEFCVAPAGVQLRGFWFFVNSSVEEKEHRLFEYEPEKEAIPQYAVDYWHEQGLDVETTMPPVINDDEGRPMVKVDSW